MKPDFEITSELMAGFLDEAAEYLRAMNRHLIDFESRAEDAPIELDNADDLGQLNELFRAAHSLKGLSAAFGFTDITALTHRMETLFDEVRTGSQEFDALAIETGLSCVALLEHLVADLADPQRRRAAATGDNDIIAPPPKTVDRSAAPADHDAGQPIDTADMVTSALDALSNELNRLMGQLDARLVGDMTHLVERAARDASAAGAPASADPAACTTVRIETQKLDAIAKRVGRLAEATATMEHIQSRLDALSSPPGASESIDDLRKRLNGVQALAGDLTDAIGLLRDIGGDLDERMVDVQNEPVAVLFSRLQRVVRDIAHDEHKRIHFEFQGEQTRASRRIVDALADPLTHVVRNAADHGIETQDERDRTGKPPIATITLDAGCDDAQLCISVRDDGRGIDLDAVRASAVQRGLATAEHVAGLAAQDIVELIFLPGLTTTDHVSEVSGRGMGMDIVANRIRSLNGTVDVVSTPGEGTTCTIRIPVHSEP